VSEDRTDNWLTLTLKYKSQDLTLMTASPSQQGPRKSLQTPAVKSYSSQKILYTRDVNGSSETISEMKTQGEVANYAPATVDRLNSWTKEKDVALGITKEV